MMYSYILYGYVAYQTVTNCIGVIRAVIGVGKGVGYVVSLALPNRKRQRVTYKNPGSEDWVLIMADADSPLLLDTISSQNPDDVD